MALTRKFLKAMGIEEEKVDQIIEAHAETVDGAAFMVEASKKYLALCHERGLVPKFSQFLVKNADGSYSLAEDAQNYWKMLVDRKMVDHTTGKIIVQQAVVPKFNVDTMLDILKNEVESPAAKEAREAEEIVVDRMLNDKSPFTKKERAQAKAIMDATLRMAIENSAGEVTVENSGENAAGEVTGEQSGKQLQARKSGIENDEADSYNKHRSGGLDSNRNAIGAQAVSGQAVGEKLRDDAGRGVRSSSGDGRGDYAGDLTEDSGVQQQRRTRIYSDREVLQFAADIVDTRSLTDGERDALRIFNERLNNLNELNERLEEQRRIYAEQKAAETPDEGEMRKTLNRLQVLGKKVKAAENLVLSIENKPVFKKILKEARNVVEHEQRSIRDDKAAREKYRKQIQETVKTLSEWLLKNSDKEHVPEILKEPVAKLLESIDLDSARIVFGKRNIIGSVCFAGKLQKETC